MKLKLVIFGAVAAMALTMPVVASTVGEPNGDLIARLEPVSAPASAIPAAQEVQVAALVRGQSGPADSSNLGGAPTLPVDQPVIVPVDLPLAPPKRVAHARVVPVVATEQVANTAPTVEFHADRLWVIGSFR